MTNLCQTFVTAEGYDLLLQEQKVNGFKVDCDAFEGSELAAKGGTEKQILLGTNAEVVRC